MHAEKNKVVAIDYTLKDADGNLIDESKEGQFSYLHGASNIIPGLEQALEGKQAGDAVQVTIQPEDAYGDIDAAKIQQAPRSMFPEDVDIQPGMQFHAQTPDGQDVMVTVTQVEEEHVVIDGNHPLAGVTLNFDVTVRDVRDASAEEIEHRHVHGPDGHQHG